jgi:hypothetical protein
MANTLISGFLVLVLGSASALAGPRDGQWKKVHDATDKGLPKSAIAALEPILAGALKEKAYPEAIKALGMKIALEGSIQGNRPEEKITRLQAEIPKYPAPMKPVLEAILAHWYWQYFEQNRWRLLQRTQTAAAPGTDLQTWDLPRILAEIDAHFTAALVNETTLEATPISAYDALLARGSAPDTYRPTLFDFLANEALLFYVAGEQGAAAAEDAFEVEAGSAIFAPAEEFLKWRPDTTEENSPALKAVRLYQKLLEFHRNDADKTAFIDSDLERLTFGNNKAVGEGKSDRYQAALKRFVDEWGKHEISARALAAWAGELQGDNKLVDARRLAQRGLDAFPESPGGRMCFNLIAQIEAKSASIQTEQVWNEPLPDIRVTYRNVTKVFFRAVPYDFESYMTTQRWGWYYLSDKQRSELLSNPAREWNADLPPTADYQEHTLELPAPKGLKPGFYFIVASHDRSFGKQDNQVSFAPIWVSDLALVVRERHYEGAIDGFVLEARTGEPVTGATVRTWTRDGEGRLQPDSSTTTDGDGSFHIAGLPRRRVILAQHGGHRIATARDFWGGAESAEGSNDRTVFFTDRSLYRPGQTIHYKGIRIRFDTAHGQYRTLARDRVTVTFSDPNNKEIVHATHRCNDYGSFDGMFTAPRDRLMGRMTLRAPDGETSIHVEEYKRPKFQVELSAPKEAAKLEALVVVPGKTTSYTGAAIGGARVRWRVQREVRYPIWWWGWRWFGGPSQEGQAIAHGTAVTENDGSFKIEFVARPDRAIAKKDEPTFEYHIFADVTDSNGETRSDDRLVRAGYTALQASLDASAWQTPDKPVELAIQTTSLDGDAEAARGTVKIYRLRQPARVVRAPLENSRNRYWRARTLETAPTPDPSDPASWDLDQVVSETPFQTDDKGGTKLSVALGAGIYRAMLETTDRFGQPVHARHQIHVIDPKARSFSTQVANYVDAPTWKCEPGEPFVALWGTGYDTGRAFVEIEQGGKLLRKYWTAARRTQELVAQDVHEDMRGGFILRVTFVRENRAYLNERIVEVPWSNKDLTVKWEHFRSKLDPGKKETWTAVITGPDAKTAVAEMVAGLYDASLDQYLPHDWPHAFGVFRNEQRWVNASFANSVLGFQQILGGWPMASRQIDLFYRAFPPEVLENERFLGSYHVRGGRSPAIGLPLANRYETPADMGLPPHMAPSAAAAMPVPVGELAQARGPRPDLGKIAARKNLEETAFFFPHLLSDAHGRVKVEFTMPEALTEWKFLGFAHDRELRSGFLTDRTVTAKDLMVEPNPPRFVREGDAIEFTVKVSNQTAESQTGRVKLTLADARTLRPMDAALGNAKNELKFDVPEKQSRSYSWRLAVPDGCEFLTYKAVGATQTLSDGEEGFLPVLSKRILVTESMPLPIRGKQTKQFEFAKLLESGKSSTLRHQSLTVQMVSQPAWYAVMALPYLMEFPYECSEQTFNRLYANALARHIAGSDPKIRRIFDQWKGAPALDSPLEKNQDLKALMLEETPWYRQAQSESEARRNLGLLFDSNQLDEETARTLRQLSEMQSSEGLWPWFPGGPPDEYISLYITTGFGRLRHLGVDLDVAPAVKSLAALDQWMDEAYRRILEHGHNDDNHLNYTLAFYLYGRSFFLKDQPVAKEHQEAVDYWRSQARKYWLALNCRQSQAHVALGLQRFGDKETPQAILKSFAERSVHNEELGMFWRDLELSWWWYRAPIETQAMMIEAFAEVAHDSVAVEDCKAWLLKQKQTQDWKTTKATADAVYALLLRGTKMLASDVLVQVTLAGKTIEPAKVEAGTGFYEQRFTRGEILPEQGRVTVTKRDEGVSWGSLHWQYLEDMSKVTPYEGTPLKLKKTLFVKDTTRKGQVLKPVTGALAVGDELVVRIELRADRDMQYVHLVDQRGSGTEPVNVLSHYRYQDGLGYYQSTRDTASHFFIDYVSKGVYVFEYSARIQHKGRYQTGVASIQCMYAPEFNSHSESFVLNVE